MILFLDFDGVLHPMNRENGPLVHVPRFEAVMRDYPMVDIVISSTWREEHSLEVLRAFFSSDIAAHVIDVTPVLPYLEHSYVRQAEIMTWLQDVGREYESWVALDDGDWLFAPQLPNLILVDGDVGFDDRTERLLRQFLDAKNLSR